MSDIANNIPYLSVIIPAYNEENRIGATLESIVKYLSGQDYTYEIIIVNDGSVDDTAKVLSEYEKNISQIRIYNNKENRGKGWAVKHGMLSALGRYRLFMDADNSTTIEHFGLMNSLLKNGVDIVIGSRRVAGANIADHQSWMRENLGRVFNLLIKIINGLNYNDTQAGFKAFSSNSAERIFSLQTLTRWSFDVELLVIAHNLGYKVNEVPIVWYNMKDSRVNLAGMLGMIKDLIKIRVLSLSGMYSPDT